jgi:hypothetical protein
MFHPGAAAGGARLSRFAATLLFRPQFQDRNAPPALNGDLQLAGRNEVRRRGKFTAMIVNDHSRDG